MRIVVGPVAAASAISWVANARLVLDIVHANRGELPVPVPDEILERFGEYLTAWDDQARAADPFAWTADIDIEEARRLGAWWYSLVMLDEATTERLAIPTAAPEAEAFYVALSTALTEALGAEDAEVGTTLQASWPEVGAAPPPTNTVEGERVRVVVVDDTEDIRLLFRIALTTDGRCEVVGEAKNGREAIDVCRLAQPDVVLLDVMMPVLDGLDALPLILEVAPSARVVMVTASMDPRVRDRALNAGAAAFLTKGNELDNLVATILRAS